VGVEGIQEEARTGKDKPYGRCKTQPEELGRQLGGSQGANGTQDRLASICGPMHPSGCSIVP